MGAERLPQRRDVEGYQNVWPMKSRWLDRSKRVVRTSVNCCWQYLKDFKAGWEMSTETRYSGEDHGLLVHTLCKTGTGHIKADCSASSSFSLLIAH